MTPTTLSKPALSQSQNTNIELNRRHSSHWPLEIRNLNQFSLATSSRSDPLCLKATENLTFQSWPISLSQHHKTSVKVSNPLHTAVTPATTGLCCALKHVLLPEQPIGRVSIQGSQGLHDLLLALKIPLFPSGVPLAFRQTLQTNTFLYISPYYCHLPLLAYPSNQIYAYLTKQHWWFSWSSTQIGHEHKTQTVSSQTLVHWGSCYNMPDFTWTALKPFLSATFQTKVHYKTATWRGQTPHILFPLTSKGKEHKELCLITWQEETIHVFTFTNVTDLIYGLRYLSKEPALHQLKILNYQA